MNWNGIQETGFPVAMIRWPDDVASRDFEEIFCCNAEVVVKFSRLHANLICSFANWPEYRRHHRRLVAVRRKERTRGITKEAFKLQIK